MGAVLKAEVKTPKEPDSSIISVRLKVALVEELEEAAREAGMSRNKAIAQLLRFALEANKAKRPKR